MQFTAVPFPMVPLEGILVGLSLNQNMVIFIAGDTALHMDIRLIGQFHSIDFALLPIGDNFTMGYEDAAIAAEMVKTKNVIGLHYDTFGFIEIDIQKQKKLLTKRMLHYLPEIGEEIKL